MATELRNNFPRAYFASDDEISSSSVAWAFTDVQSLKTDEADTKVLGFVSDFNDEFFPFTQAVEKSQKDNAEFLNSLLEASRQSVKKAVEASINNYPSVSKNEFVKGYFHALLASISTHWTSQTEKAIKSTGAKGISEYLVAVSKQIEEFIDLVNNSGLSRNELETTRSLIGHQINNRDILNALVKENVQDLADYLWQSHVRHYWESNDLKVRFLRTTLNYQYEYFGNKTVLVAIPQTERYYRTISLAIDQNLGGHLYGPAGTGQTQTIRNFAMLAGQYNIILNCSDQIDVQLLSKYFTGAASTGSWLIFDEFNRIELEVVSQAGQLIGELLSAQKANAKSIKFEGFGEVALQQNANVFLTLNPGYAGRTELPESYKSLFRGKSTVVPDIQTIFRSVLASAGLREYEQFAAKLVRLFKILQEEVQVANQHWYDFGLRNYKRIADRVGAEKRNNPKGDQTAIVFKVLIETQRSRYPANDLALFDSLLTQFFPGVKEEPTTYKDFVNALDEELKAGTYPGSFRLKAIQLYENLHIRQGVIVYGKVKSGKTALIELVRKTIDRLDKSLPVSFTKYASPTDLPAFYGTNETDGEFSKQFRELSQSKENNRKLIVFEGNVSPMWVENLNTLLDDNRVYCTVTGERISLPNNTNIVFETTDLLGTSPAFISRNGIVYVD